MMRLYGGLRCVKSKTGKHRLRVSHRGGISGAIYMYCTKCKRMCCWFI